MAKAARRMNAATDRKKEDRHQCVVPRSIPRGGAFLLPTMISGALEQTAKFYSHKYRMRKAHAVKFQVSSPLATCHLFDNAGSCNSVALAVHSAGLSQMRRDNLAARKLLPG